jgi:hypothetical protein
MEAQENKNELQVAEDGHIKLDYTLETPEERNELVKVIINNTPPEKLTARYLKAMADYILLACKDEIKEKKILTKSRLQNTIRVREVSFEGLSTSFENKYAEGGKNNSGEDYVYNLIIENDKNIILTPKKKITEQDIEEIPGMKELFTEIKRLETQVFPLAKGQQRYSVKKNIIELYKDTYVLKSAYRGTINYSNPIKSATSLDIYENVIIDKDGELIIDTNLSLMVPKHVCALLCNYAKLKENAYSKFTSDIYYMMLALDDIADEALKDYPVYNDIVLYKIDGLQNKDIQKLIEEKHGIKYSVEYISSLWRNKIPKLIAETAQERWLIWHFTEEEKGAWKKCSKCNCIKLAHPKFFSKNKSSKDGFYSICKDCRNKKKGIKYNG